MVCNLYMHFYLPFYVLELPELPLRALGYTPFTMHLYTTGVGSEVVGYCRGPY